MLPPCAPSLEKRASPRFCRPTAPWAGLLSCFLGTFSSSEGSGVAHQGAVGDQGAVGEGPLSAAVPDEAPRGRAGGAALAAAGVCPAGRGALRLEAADGLPGPAAAPPAPVHGRKSLER